MSREYEFYGRQSFSYYPKDAWIPDHIGICDCNCRAAQESIELMLNIDDACHYCYDQSYNLSEEYRIQSIYDEMARETRNICPD